MTPRELVAKWREMANMMDGPIGTLRECADELEAALGPEPSRDSPPDGCEWRGDSLCQLGGGALCYAGSNGNGHHVWLDNRATGEHRDHYFDVMRREGKL